MGVMKATLILIGGGEIGNGETRPVDEKVRSYSSKENPHLLFLGTASGDPESYTEAVRSVYGELSCEVEPLSIANETPSPEDLKEALAWADMMYIGGGNTKTLIKRLKETGLDQLLLKALNERENFVLAGLSAGASCWCEASYADCDIMDGISDKMVFLSCLGYLPYVFNPHAQDPSRTAFLEDLKSFHFKTAYSLENDTALIIQGKKVVEFFRGYEDKRGWRITKDKNGRLKSQEL
jgi:dipeptidase E